MQVVMVHGIRDTGAKFRRMQPYLEARGHRCLAPSLTPNDGRDGLEPLARQLGDAVDAAWGPQARFALIGFSMGALIARLYLQELGAHRRCDRFFAVSAPMAGSAWAWLGWGEGVRQMRPGSALLRRLDRGVDRLRGTALYSYWTPLDAVIVPPTSSVWPRARNRRIWAACHPCMLWNRALLEDIAKNLHRAD
jgi:triacylglycerol lipase